MDSKTFEELKELENIFSSIIKDSYLRITSNSTVLKAQELYKTITGNNKYEILACNNCTFNLFYTLGRLYFKEKEELEKNELVINPIVKAETKVTSKEKVKPITKTKKNASKSRTSNK